MAHAFAAPKRLEIIDILAQGERDVETLAREARATVANTSRHLQILKQARLVGARKEGPRAFYRLADPAVFRCWKHLQGLAESQLPEVRDAIRDYSEDRDRMEPISRDELRRRVRRGEVIVLDVRPPEEFKAGHIRGAVSVPLSEITRRLGEIPTDREVVAYCRGPYCVLSVEAVALLRKAGRRAVRLADGLPEWREAGLAVETGSAEE
ncbi:MAG: metalloregulator ArsR/SmtB family transcription factor [Candidatus Eisenbacteria bacterium]